MSNATDANHVYVCFIIPSVWSFSYCLLLNSAFFFQINPNPLIMKFSTFVLATLAIVCVINVVITAEAAVINTVHMHGRVIVHATLKYLF